jgi:hypothetical protein
MTYSAFDPPVGYEDGSVVQSKTELDRDLPVINFIILNVAAAFDDLKPVQVVQRLCRLGDGVLDRIFHARFRRTRELDLFINMLVHKSSLDILGCAIKVPTSQQIILIQRLSDKRELSATATSE